MVKKSTFDKFEKDLGRLFDLSPDLIGVGNLDGYFTKVNFSFEKLLGYSEKEFYENKFFTFIHDDDIKKTEDVLAMAVNGKQNIRIENRYKCKKTHTNV
jgi:two-component system sensor histidine kinase/response regulator